MLYRFPGLAGGFVTDLEAITQVLMLGMGVSCHRVCHHTEGYVGQVPRERVGLLRVHRTGRVGLKFVG